MCTGFPDQLTFEPCDSLQLYDTMLAVLSQRRSPALPAAKAVQRHNPGSSAVGDRDVSPAWSAAAAQRMAVLAPEHLTSHPGANSIYISRRAARDYEHDIKQELETWAREGPRGMQLVAEVLNVLAPGGSVSQDGGGAPAFAAQGPAELFRMVAGLHALEMLPALVFNFSR